MFIIMKDSFQLLKKYIYFYNSLKTHSLTRLRGKSRKTKEREASWNEGVDPRNGK